MRHVTDIVRLTQTILTVSNARMIQLATSFNFVAHTLAATSAERLSVLTKSQHAANDAARYRALALAGLSREIQSFSKHNADAVLSSYLGCSFIMSD